MADKKISQLTNITGANLANDDEFAVVDTSVNETKAITFGELSGRFTTDIDNAVTAAEAAQAAAEAAEANTILIFDQFGDQYLGPKASDPTVDNDGNPLVEGAIYYNTTDDVLKFYSGTAWVAPEVIATTAAANALTSETNAATSESNAATSESNAATSASNAATSEANAAASYDAFDDRYLGSKASAPTVDNDGNALLTGALYWDSTQGGMYVWNGASWELVGSNSEILQAISATKAVTAVDVFVYDTSKDSDGGAWRKRTQHTSWYNETLNTSTRGSRREFPAVAVIVAESGKVTIYDGDDPSLPMWMVFNGVFSGSLYPALINILAGGRGLSMLNGVLVGGRSFVSFIDDNLGGFWFTSGFFENTGNGLVNRNVNYSHPLKDSSLAIVNNTNNDVAMTVLPNAPIDPATGLPVPTIAVATDGGVSVIKDDGTVVDITHTSSQIVDNISLNDEGLLFTTRTGTPDTSYFHHLFYDIPTSDVANGTGYSGSTADEFYVHSEYGSGKLPFYRSSTNGFHIDDKLSLGGTKGLQSVYRSTSVGVALYNAITSTYNTGWMNGDIKGAFLSDTDDTDLVGGNVLTNSDFSTGDETGWTVNSSYIADGSVDFTTTGQATITEQNGSDRSFAQQVTGSKAGDIIKVTLEVTNNTATGGAQVRIAYGANSGATTPYVSVEGTGTKTFYIVAGNDDQWLNLHCSATNVTITVTSFEAEIADADRSVKKNHLTVNGTITRSPVETGADLVAYSGFSASNYLEQPYNSDLDFGTGDFCVMGWVNVSNGNDNQVFLSRTESGAGYIGLQANNDSIYFYATTYAAGQNISAAVSENTWVFVTGVRKDGVAYLYLNGKLKTSAARAADVSVTSDPLYIGYTPNTPVAPSENISLALLRISATAPTAEQIKKIYEDEKVLFQENAQATLYGSSDAVTALAHDPVTDLLHVGTSAGRSVFQGLRRVDNTTTAVGTAISASNGLVVEE